MTMKSFLGAALVAIVAVAHGEGEEPATRHVPCQESGPACGAALQAAIKTAPAGATITLDAGKVYEATLVISPREGAGASRRLTLTTRGWKDKGPGWDGLVTPADKARMAIIRGAPRETAAINIVNGPGAGFVTLTGLAFEATPPAGQGDVIRIGSGDAHTIAQLPRDIVIRQVLLQGNRDFGQRRGIAANGVDIQITQLWCEEIFNAGQDSQCVAAWNGGKRIRITHSYLAAASENILVGGAAVPTAEMQPEDWLIEDVILHKPLRWKDDGRNRQVKNLLEYKHGRKLVARRILAVNNWRAAQDGRGLLLHYSTNGRCPACGNLEEILIEDFVMLNVDAGVSLQGYSWQKDSFSDGKLKDVTLRNLYVQIAGGGRAIQMANVLGVHNITIARSTIINGGTSWLMASYGRAWRDDESLGDGGPIAGLRVVNNVFANNGEYGVTAPETHHFGSGLGEFVSDRLQIAGNVFGDAPGAHLNNYNRYKGDGEANDKASRAELLKRLPATTCGEWKPGKGADCARLKDVFEWLKRLPEP